MQAFEKFMGICRQPHDYEVRQGITSLPLTAFPFNKAPRPLHSRSRTGDWVEELLTRLAARVHSWGGRLTEKQKEALADAKDFVKVAPLIQYYLRN